MSNFKSWGPESASTYAVPVVAHYHPSPLGHEIEKAERLAGEIHHQHPELRVAQEFHSLVPTQIEQAPTLHIDDLSLIKFPGQGYLPNFYQERARQRANTSDVIATTSPVVDGYEAYCRDQLQLGTVRWLHPQPPRVANHLAEACWQDDVVRSELISRVTSGDLRYIHPNMGTLAVWELASLLRETTGQPIKVIAPSPELTAWVNDKIVFTDLVRRLFGDQSVPRTLTAGNYAMLAEHVKELANTCPSVGIKLKDSAGGDGTIVLHGDRLRTQSLALIHEEVKRGVRALHWDGSTELVIDCWEQPIVCTPSAQLWIPPITEAEPVVEGLFTQVVVGEQGVFAGSTPADFPAEVAQQIVNRSWLIAKVFQRLGYVGRCSFDTILIGKSVAESRLKFIECNGRWGGTSAPMTLMNRLFGDWKLQPYITRICKIEKPRRGTFQQLITKLGSYLYDRTTGNGRIILLLPGCIAAHSATSLIVLGSTTADAQQFYDHLLKPLLGNFNSSSESA